MKIEEEFEGEIAVFKRVIETNPPILGWSSLKQWNEGIRKYGRDWTLVRRGFSSLQEALDFINAYTMMVEK